MGMVTAMAIVIEYYIPEKFRKQGGKWIPPEQRGKVIPFPYGDRILHDMETLGLVQASEQFGAQPGSGFCSPQQGSAYLDL